MDVQGRVRLRFQWTYLEELSIFAYETTKKGAKGEAEMSIFGFPNNSEQIGVTISRRSAAVDSMLLRSTQKYMRRR